VRPLGLYFWGQTWSLAAWCELRQDFRNFRLDRIMALTVLPERFADEPGQRLEDFVRKMQAES
jgi:predicted DNA-binding transcriptional regulator YafY